MSEDSGQEKTEEPTSKKLEESKKKGQIARSKELGTMFVLIFSAISLLMYGPEIGKGLYNVMGRTLSLNRNEAFDTTKMFAVWGEVADALMFPIIGGATLTGLFLGITQVKFLDHSLIIILLFILIGIMGSSRLILKRHTPNQVYAGGLLGLIIPYIFVLNEWYI